MGSIGSSETSVLNHRTPRNNPEDGWTQLNRGGDLRSRNVRVFVFFLLAVGLLLLNHHLIMISVLETLIDSRYIFPVNAMEV
jgi:hypothetical protein